jgi:hypothetical protein
MRTIQLKEILQFTSDFVGIPVEEIKSKCRIPDRVRGRVVYSHLCRRFTSASLSEICSILDTNDHSVIVHYTAKHRKPSHVHAGVIEQACIAFEKQFGAQIEAFTDATMSVNQQLMAYKRRLEDERQESLLTFETVMEAIKQSNEGWLMGKLQPILDEQIKRRQTLLGLRDVHVEGEDQPDGVLSGVCSESSEG